MTQSLPRPKITERIPLQSFNGNFFANGQMLLDLANNKYVEVGGVEGDPRAVVMIPLQVFMQTAIVSPRKPLREVSMTTGI